MNELLYGKGTTKNIVCVELVPNKENVVQVWIRDGDQLTSEYHTYTPYCYISSQDPIIESFYEDTPTVPLLGSNPLDLMIKSETFANISWIEKGAKKCYVPFRQSQWMIQTGETLFKEMNFDDPVRLYFDLEVLTTEGFSFPNSSRPDDKIMIIAIYSNRGHEIILALNEDGLTPKMDKVYRCKDEATLIQKFIKVVREIDPDVIANHNIYGFDFPYLRDRCQFLDIPLQIGRNGSVPRTYTTSIKFAEKSDEYENFVVYGRHILDTYFMAKNYDSIARALKSLSLKECVKHLGMASDDRTYIEGGDISSVWRNTHDTYTREDLIRYALDDVKEAQIIDREWGIGIFEETKMIPLPMQDVARYGAGNKIDLIFDRHYYRAMWSIPVADEKQNYGGGYAGSQVYGYVPEPMVYADVSSLYPTLAELLEIQPPKDELGIFQTMVRTLKEFRYKYKYLAKKLYGEGKNVEAKRYDAAQNQYKRILNTGAYGWLGWQWGKFNYYEGASKITEWGRKLIKKVNESTEVLDGKVIRTDSVTEDTPIYIKDEMEQIDIISIGELHSRGIDSSDSLRKFKGYDHLQVLTRGGWSNIKYTKKHAVDKTIYQVLTRNGYAKVTEDHSLFQDGKEIKPKDLNIGDRIDELPYEDFGSKITTLTEDQAWLLGFMVSDGSASKVPRKKGGWSVTTAVHKSDKTKLQRCKEILDNWGFDFKFYDTMQSSGCYRLATSKGEVYDFFYPLLYDSYTGEKKVPKEILNAPNNIILSFLKGQMDGDGHIINRPETVNITTKSYILAAGLQYLCHKVQWYKTSIVSIRPDKPNIVSLNFSNPTRKQPSENGVVRKLTTLDYSKEVYDISTDDGTFIGGCGNVIFHNTDGSLITVPVEYRGSMENELTFIKLVQDRVNEWLNEELGKDDAEIVLEHDGAVKKAVIFDNKSYVLLGHDDSITIKGNTLKGRSNEGFVNKFIRTSIDHIFNETPELILSEYESLKTRITNKKMHVDEIIKRESLNMSLEEYRNKRSAGQNAIGTYEAAIHSDKHYVKGDTINTWVEEPDAVLKEYKNKENEWIIPKTSAYEQIRTSDKFNGNIYVDHYLKRLENTCKRFIGVIGPKLFMEWFPDISILKTDRRKLIQTMDIEDFLVQFPDHGWTEKCVEQLTETQKQHLTNYKKLGILPDELLNLI